MMQKGFVFSIECKYEQVVWDKYTTSHGVMISASDTFALYGAMDNMSIIPSLKTMVDSVSEKNRRESIKKWIRKYGFLTASNYQKTERSSDCYISRTTEGEDLEAFWREAKQLVSLWDIYSMVANKDFVGLLKIVFFFRDPLFGVTEGSVYPTGKEPGRHTTSTHTVSFDKTLEEIYKDPLRYYQVVAFEYITKTVESKLQGLSLASEDICFAEGIKQDLFKFTPVIKAQSLLQALYLQFYILLSTPGKKICETCYKPFTPLRMDMKYCNDTCKNTAKSRRQRGRRRKMVDNIFDSNAEDNA